MESILTQTLMNRRARVDAKQIIQLYATEDRQSQNVDGRTYDHGLEQQHFENRLAELQDRARILGDNPPLRLRLAWLMQLTIGTEDPTDRLLDPDTGKNKELTPGQWQSYICNQGREL